MFGLFEKQACDTFKYIALSVLRIKTRLALGTVTMPYKHPLDGRKLVKCKAGPQLFTKTVPDPEYCSQLCQRTAALDLKYVHIVDSVSGGLLKTMVLIDFSRNDRELDSFLLQ